MDKFNAIEAAIDKLGGGTDGMKELAYLLKVTTTRVYQMRKDGVVKNPEHALRLAQRTGISFQDFLIQRGGPGAKPTNGGRKNKPQRSTVRMRMELAS